jgi:hypothetical protein
MSRRSRGSSPSSADKTLRALCKLARTRELTGVKGALGFGRKGRKQHGDLDLRAGEALAQLREHGHPAQRDACSGEEALGNLEALLDRIVELGDRDLAEDRIEARGLMSTALESCLVASGQLQAMVASFEPGQARARGRRESGAGGGRRQGRARRSWGERLRLCAGSCARGSGSPSCREGRSRARRRSSKSPLSRSGGQAPVSR